MRPSNARWVEGPFPLIETPSTKLKSDHFYLKAASEMTHAHNVLLRSLNSILQQGPNIPTSGDTNYQERNIIDFLYYVRCWVKTVHHHHWVEETFIFPEMGKFSGNPGLMDGPRHQHESFQAGLEELEEYLNSTRPDQYRWLGSNGSGGMKQIIDSFSHHLTDHLYAEIEVFLQLKDLDSEEYKKTWAKAEAVAKQSGNFTLLYEMVPMVLGCADKTYEGARHFPPFPWIMPYIVKYWFAAGNGAWRFNPCDFWGQPRPLVFITEGEAGN